MGEFDFLFKISNIISTHSTYIVIVYEKKKHFSCIEIIKISIELLDVLSPLSCDLQENVWKTFNKLPTYRNCLGRY